MLELSVYILTIIQQASQKYPEGRKVWYKSSKDGAFAMTVRDASHNPGTNTWSYQLTASDGEEYTEWVAETRLSGSRPKKR